MIIKIIQLFLILCLTFMSVHANVKTIRGTWTVTVKKGDVTLYQGDKLCKFYMSDDYKRFTFKGVYEGDYSVSGTLIEEDEK